MRNIRIAIYIMLASIIGFFLNQLNVLLQVVFIVLISLMMVELVVIIVNSTFFRFDDDPGLCDESSDKLSVETFELNNLHMKLVKSHHTPEENAPVVIMHHGYGSNYRRMLVYANPIALNGYAVLLYNAWGHGKVVKEGGREIDERSPGDKTEIIQIMNDLTRIVDFIKSRPDLGNIGFVGISLGAIVGLTYGICNPDVKCVIAMAGLHNFQKTATRRLVPLTADWWMKKSYEWSQLEMKPSNLQDFIVSPEFHLDKQFGFFNRPVWAGIEKNAEKIFLIHAKNDVVIPYWNFLENIKKLNLPENHYLGLNRGNHWFIRQEHLLIGQIISWLNQKLK
ncbi:MAG: alpha/beta hydrolase [Candidatus Hodarchaeota archaeon]